VHEAGRVAVVAALDGKRPDLAQRRKIVALAKRHGFMSVCLELDAPVSGA
jgi:predicted kinase